MSGGPLETRGRTCEHPAPSRTPGRWRGRELTSPRTHRALLRFALVAALGLLGSATAAPAAAAEPVALSASRGEITYGQHVILAGQIQTDPACAAERQVQLAWRMTDADPWSIVGTATTADDATFSFTDGPTYSGQYSAQAPAIASCASAASPSVTVQVRALVETGPVPRSIDAGRCIGVDASVSPPKPGQVVSLQRRSAGSWSTIQTVTLDAASTAHASTCFGWKDLGVVRLRMAWPTQDAANQSGTSRTITLDVVKARWMRAIDHAIGGRAVSVDVAGDEAAIYQHADAAARTPASNEKLLLSMALLDRFGVDHRIPTIAAAAHVRGGTVRGDLWILGRGDPEIAPARLGALAAELRDAGIRRIRGRVMGARTYFRHDWSARGWKPYTRRYVAMPTALTFEHNVVGGREIRDPERRAAASLTKQLERRGVRVRGRPSGGRPPSDALPIAQIASRPLLTLIRAMDRPSDNYYAEVLGKMLGAARSGPPGTIAKAANAIQAYTDSHGADFRSYDSSGLSYDNRVSARGIVRLLAFANQTTWGSGLRHALATGGQGTLKGRLQNVKVRAKTGTLDGISALSGWVWARHEGRWVEFSILSSGISKTTAMRIEDKIVHVVSEKARTA